VLWVFLSVLWGVVHVAGGYRFWPPVAPATIRVPLNQVKVARPPDVVAQGPVRLVLDEKGNLVPKPGGNPATPVNPPPTVVRLESAPSLMALLARLLATATAVWAVPAFALYAFGWGVGRVRRGFAAPPQARRGSHFRWC
jgi:hypothetical protein